MSNPLAHLAWIDLEMTGLDTSSDAIIEIAAVVTDKDLQIVAEGPNLVIYQPGEVLSEMDEWNQKQHQYSGLLEEVKNSRIHYHEAEQKVLGFFCRHIEKKHSPMCGSSICQDRRFLARLMPDLEDFFHYRNLDVSAVKELVLRWKPEARINSGRASRHRALDDVYRSIEELKHYRKHFIQF